MNRTILLLGLAMASCSAAPQAPKHATLEAEARALDGDTVTVDFRLLGVDAFERKQLCERANACWQCGKTAQDVAARALRDKTAVIQLTPSTTYGRPVSIITINGEDLGEMMIRAGLAVPEAEYLRRDPERASRYEAAFAQAEAKRAGALAGRWIAPSKWRHGERLECER